MQRLTSPSNEVTVSYSGVTPPAEIVAKQHHAYYSGGNAQYVCV